MANTNDATRPSTEREALLHLAQHLASEMADGGGRCSLLADDGGRCKDPDAAVRWEYGFADVVCEDHAERAALVLYPRRHDGTETTDPRNRPDDLDS